MKKNAVYDDETLSLFLTQIAMIYESGLDLREGLSFLESSKKINNDHLLSSLKENGKLSQAMEKDGHFPREALLAMKAAEAIGQEASVAEHLAHFYQRQAETTTFLKEILVMPLMLITILILVMAVLSFVVIPVFQDVYLSLGGSVAPWIEILLTLTKFIVLLSVISLAVGLLWILIEILRSALTHQSLDLTNKILSLFPQRKSKADLARFTFITQLVLKAGINQKEAMELALSQVPQGSLKMKLDEKVKTLTPSQGLYDLLLVTSLYPPLLQNTLIIAHKTGKTDEVLDHLSLKSREDAEASMMGLLNRIEPILILTLSGFVALVLFSLIIPLIGIMSSLG